MPQELTMTITGPQGSGKTLLMKWLIAKMEQERIILEDRISSQFDRFGDGDKAKFEIDLPKLIAFGEESNPESTNEKVCRKSIVLPQDIYHTNGFVFRLMHNMIGLFDTDEPEWSERLIIEVASDEA